MKLTPGTGALLAGLITALVDRFGIDRKQAHDLAMEMLADGTQLSDGVNRLRREAFEAGASPALAELLVEFRESEPGPFQEGLARAVTLLSQELGQHYGSVFEAGVRIGRIEAEKAQREGV